MKFKNNLIILFAVIGMGITKGQTPPVNAKLLKGSWPAFWITHPATQQREYGIYHFRKKITLTTSPSAYLIHVTADNRYRLFVNGNPVCSGPARGDLFNWFYETINIASFLKQGENTIAALVWNMGELAPVAQVSNQTAFLIQGNTESEKEINTNSGWKVLKSTAYIPCSLDNGERLKAYMVVGPGDQVDGTQYLWGWEKPGYNDTLWEKAQEIAHPEPVGHGTDNRWTLAPRNIPLFKESIVRFPQVRRSTGIEANNAFLSGLVPLSIPTHQTVSILLDVSSNIAAYPELEVSSGKGSTVKMTYAEALFDSQGNKGNRNEIESKEIKGNYDVFLPDGVQTGNSAHYGSGLIVTSS